LGRKTTARDRDGPLKEPPEKRGRKPYRPPEIRVHGTVETITGNLGSTNTDGVIGSSLP